MTRAKVLILGKLNTQLPEYQRFSEKYECIRYSATSSREETISDLKTKFSDVSAIYTSWLGFHFVGGCNNELIEAFPESLKVVSSCGVGYDNYNGAQLRAKNIVLTNVPSHGAAGPVADLVLFNTLAAFRNLKTFMKCMRPDTNNLVAVRNELNSTDFDCATGTPVLGSSSEFAFGQYVGGRPCLSPHGHNVVIVGFGNIGRTIGQRLSSVGMKIHYVKRTQLTTAEESALGFPVQYHKSIQDTTSFADLLVIACPASPETHHLVDQSLLDSFAKPIRVINIGRGSVIHEQALVDSLKSGKVIFAGLDVFENEPTVHPDLYNRQDVILTPHIGSSTVENYDHSARVALENIDMVLSGKPALTPVN